MPLTRLAVDALGVVTICLVSLFVLLGSFCIIHTLYFRSRVRSSNYVQLGYFNGPWVARIAFVLFGIWWGIGEVIRLSFLRQKGGIFGSLDLQWQEDLCKYYVLSNLGFAEPCLFLTMSFLLHASLQWRESGISNQRWNLKTMSSVLFCSLLILLLDLVFVLVGPKFGEGKSKVLKLPDMFIGTARRLLTTAGKPATAICTYPLLCTILHGLFATILTSYLLLVGRRLVSSVINKGLRKRICILIFVVVCFLPSRVVCLGLSVLAKAHFLLEALAFCGFIVLLSCVVVGVFVLVYLPVADSLALSWGLRGSEEEGGGSQRSGYLAEDYIDSISPVGVGQGVDSVGRASDASTKRGSISFRTMIRDEDASVGIVGEEPTTFSQGPNQDLLSSASSPSSPAGQFIFFPFL